MEPASEIHYQRLTRFSLQNTFSSLWLGPDHLLRTNSNGYVETYKRFYFRDIQAIIVQKNRRRAVFNAILAFPVLVCLFGVLACLTYWLSPSEVGAVVWSIFLGIFLLFLLINHLLGVGCACHIRTAVQIERLPSLCRVPKTERVLDKIRPLIAAAQGGEMSAETVSSRMRELLEPAAATTSAQTSAENSNNPAAPNV
ncbi:MAG TPA: hypothetical protein VMH87_15340 [Pseudomonadales bacterium]|nr:hypothetical protein [Pseudomonadales bacterium]